MIFLNELKTEAKLLLDEVNGNFERWQYSSHAFNCNTNTNPENFSVKERAKILRRKFQVLQGNKIL